MPTKTKASQMTAQQRLDRIAEIIEGVDYQAQFVDGPIPKTRHAMTDKEFREIYRLATARRSGSDGQGDARNEHAF